MPSPELQFDKFLAEHAEDTISTPVTAEEFMAQSADDVLSPDMTVEEYFAHYGVLGMKWGRRKSEGNSAVPSAQSDDHINVASLRKKKLSQLSNAEIKAVTERLNLEKKFKEVNPSDHELMMRKLKKRVDTGTKILKWMAGPEGGVLLKAMGLDAKSRKADAKAKEQAAAEKRKAEAKAKAEKKNEKKAAKKAKADAKPKLKKEYIGPDGGVVYR